MSRQRLIVWALVCCALDAVAAQPSQISPAPVPLFVNDEWERYRRIQQITGDVALYPWSVRIFGPLELERIQPLTAEHPWSHAMRGDLSGHALRAAKKTTIGVLPARFETIVNTGYPFGHNDGALWAGRGLTAALDGGVWGSLGPISGVLAPIVFVAENRGFALSDNGLTGDFRYADPFEPLFIDQPQRFGSASYARLHPGQSGVRVDYHAFAAGFSTANQHWGPARDYPIILGNNAAGFPHVFVGSSRPIRLWIVDAHGRLLWGKLSASRYTPMRASEPDRFATGLAFTLTPRGVPGLELGAARFFHVLWSDGVLNQTNLTRVFGGLLTGSSPESNPTGSHLDNQIASLFFRWVFPASGLELYGEFGREATYADLSDLALNPNNDAGVLLGFQRAWRHDSGSRRVVRSEILNTRISGLQIAHEQSRFYRHSPIGQGHTNEGQVLGAVGGFGGGAATIAYDSYAEDGRWTISWSRLMRAERRDSLTDIPIADRADVMQAISVDGVRFRGRAALTLEVTAVQELNRNFGNDAFNLRLASGVRYVW